MWRNFFSTYFFVTLLAVTFAAGLVWLPTFRGYEGEVNILVISERSTSDVQATLEELSESLAFYERLLQKNPSIKDPYAGLTADERKRKWMNDISIRVEPGSDVLGITIFQSNQSGARLVARAAAETLLDEASRYYNVRTEADFRIVDGPFVRSVVRDIPIFVILSIGSALAVTILFFASLATLEGVLEKSMKRRSRMTPKVFQAETPHIGWLADEAHVTGSMRRFDESMPNSSKQAKAPANLPILDEEELPPLQNALSRLVVQDIDETARRQASEPMMVEESQSTAEPNTTEPTQEEYKRRLNALLSGKM